MCYNNLKCNAEGEGRSHKVLLSVILTCRLDIEGPSPVRNVLLCPQLSDCAEQVCFNKAFQFLPNKMISTSTRQPVFLLRSTNDHTPTTCSFTTEQTLAIYCSNTADRCEFILIQDTKPEANVFNSLD